MIQLDITETELELIVIMAGDAIERESDLTKMGAFFTLRQKTNNALEAVRNTDA